MTNDVNQRGGGASGDNNETNAADDDDDDVDGEDGEESEEVNWTLVRRFFLPLFKSETRICSECRRRAVWIA